MFLALLDLICIICHDWVIFKWLCQLNSKVDSFNINSYCLFKPKNKIFLILDLICWFTMLREWFASGCVCWISTIGPSSSLRNQTGLLQRKTIKDEGLQKNINHQRNIKLAQEIFTKGGGEVISWICNLFLANKFSATGGGSPKSATFFSQKPGSLKRLYGPYEALFSCPGQLNRWHCQSVSN